jgi:integrase
MKVRNFIRDWREIGIRRYTESYRPTVEGIIRKHIVPRMGHLDIEKVGVLCVERFKAELLDSGLAPSTVRNAINTLSRIMDDARRWGRIKSNPCREVAKPRDTTTPEEFDNYIDTEEDLRKLLEAASDLGEDIGAFLWLMVRTGARSGEIRALDSFRDLDFSSSTVKISRKVYNGQEGTPKGRRTRVIQLTAAEMGRVRAQVLRHPESPLLFPGPGGRPWSHVAPNRWLKRACKAAGVRRITPHGLRHTAGTVMIRMGVSAEQAAHFLGHASTATTRRYVHLTGMDAEAAGMVLSGAIDGQRAGTG